MDILKVIPGTFKGMYHLRRNYSKINSPNNFVV